MKAVKRIACIFLSVMVLFFGVSNSYFSPVKMDQVNAAEAEALYMTYQTMQAICYYFGSLVLGYSSVAEVPDLTEEQIEKVGHAYIKSLFTVNGVPDSVADKLATANQALFTLISNKQAYVFGSEALKEVAETEFQVIMGGNNGEEEPSPSPDKDGKKPLNLGNVVDCLGALSVAGYSIFEDSLQYYVDKFSKGEECFLDQEYLAQLLKEKYFDSEIIDQMLSGETYELKVVGASSVKKCPTCGNSGTEIVKFPSEAKGLHALGYLYDSGGRVYYSHWYYDNARKGIYTISTTLWSYSCHPGVITRGNVTFGAESVFSNIPVFRDSDARKDFLKTGAGYENALNYLKEYRIADWLQEDWAGELVDPLTGLSYLNDLANLAKHQGLNALGNDPSLDDMKQHLRDIIANLQPGYDPVTNPSVDPALDPICYPDTIPTPIIDPTADVVLRPAEDPTPSPDPDPSPSTSPKPTTKPSPSPGEIDSTKPVVDLSKFFPFCVPFDLIHLVQVLDAEPVAPRWEVKLEPPLFPVEWEIVIDMADFEALAKIFRTGETLLFVVGLILITRGIIKG